MKFKKFRLQFDDYDYKIEANGRTGKILLTWDFAVDRKKTTLEGNGWYAIHWWTTPL